MEEYHLRNSETANNLRSQLSGFEPTEDEFRKLFHLQKSIDDTFGEAFDGADETKTQARSKAALEARVA